MTGPSGARRPWRVAWQEALYADAGFYRRPEGPAGHFRTAVHAAPGQLAAALRRLAAAAGCTRVVDVGAGRGELLTALARDGALCASTYGAGPAADGLPLELVGVDVVPRPTGLPAVIGWRADVPSGLEDTLLLGWELLDTVPCDVAEADGSGRLRLVEVDGSGAERLGARLGGERLAWCHRWWPGPWPPGTRVEVGTTRDAAWSATTSHLASGLSLAVDYCHDRSTRPAAGTLTGYRTGRQVRPVPDGRADVTAHVALDAVARALEPGGRPVLLLQREALRRLGTGARRPDPRTAATDPAGYVAALSRSGEAAELLHPDGLGGFGWLLQAKGQRASSWLTSWGSAREGRSFA